MTKFFTVKVSKVEEMFEKIYKPESMTDAKSEGQVEFELKSRGWFVSLEGWGVAVMWSENKPDDIAAGDDLVIGMQKKPTGGNDGA